MIIVGVGQTWATCVLLHEDDYDILYQFSILIGRYLVTQVRNTGLF